MALLDPKISDDVRAAFADLRAPARLVVFTQGEGGALECETCSEARRLAEEVSALSEEISLEVLDLVGDAERAKAHGVDKIPALAILRGGAEPKDFGIRFFGIPSGYEFASLIEAIRIVSRGSVELEAKTRDELAHLTAPVHIQVFVTPTCPYCPRAVLDAYRLAVASEWITADAVEANEFPHLANRYRVYGVPRTVIDDAIHIEGAVPESALVSKLMTVTDSKQMERLRETWRAPN